MDIQVYNKVKSVKVSKTYVSEYSKPWVSEDTHSGNDKFFRAFCVVMQASPKDIINLQTVGEYDISHTLTLEQLMSFFAYELMTHSVVTFDKKFHNHSSGYGKDDVVVNGAVEPAMREGHDPRSAFNDGLRHYNLEQAEAAEKASAEFWKKVEEMKEGNQ
jgi:hypothetical protein